MTRADIIFTIAITPAAALGAAVLMFICIFC